MAKGTFYRHFSSKEEVFAAALHSIGDEVAVVAGSLRAGTTARSASTALGRAFRPFVALVLEGMSRELRGEPMLSGATAEVEKAIATALAPRLRPGGLQTARRIVQDAFIDAVRRAIGG